MAFIANNKDVFAESSCQLGTTNIYKHTIDTGDAPPTRRNFYRVSPHMKDEIDTQVQDMMDNDIIEESDSNWTSPVVMVKKKSGEYRFAVDYRQLNKVTKSINFPLPRLEDVFEL